MSLAVGSALAAMQPTTHFFIEIAIMLKEMEIERKKDASGQLLLDMDGFVDHGIGVLAELSHTFELMLTCVVRQTTCPV
jgi:hypothetical protein